jgi:predicted transcriptional regulator
MTMGKYKEHPKNNVLSIRVTDEEKELFDEIKRHTRKNISMLMREAMQLYSPYVEVATSHGR